MLLLSYGNRSDGATLARSWTASNAKLSLSNGDWNGWVEPGKEFIMGATKLNQTYIFVEGLGVRYSDVYGIPPDQIIAYYDREYGWPVRLTYSQHPFHGEHFSGEADLVETNIPGLSRG